MHAMAVWAQQVLMKPPHAFGSHLAIKSVIEKVCWKRRACLALIWLYRGQSKIKWCSSSTCCDDFIKGTMQSTNQSINIFNVLGGNWDPTDKKFSSVNSYSHNWLPTCKAFPKETTTCIWFTSTEDSVFVTNSRSWRMTNFRCFTRFSYAVAMKLQRLQCSVRVL